MTRPVDPEKLAARFIALEVHESTHDRLVWRMRQNRDKAVAGVPEWESLRELASQIKEHTLTHLDRYLEEFEANATKLGTHVHWARDAHEHNAIVHDILQAHRVKSLIKSKSMLQEECGMTPYLEKRGIEVTESDLGERIQQLDHERPSHIVVPAIHKLRTDVAALFARDLGTDRKDSDPHYLAEAMRQNARPRFLRADAGMTGANFAVAETGGFVVCTNEGNADIGASVPPLHIASIGIEKLIPRAQDLGVFIRMLSRSALGSAITQYTSHFHGPRRGGELHVVLLDNTRSERLASPDFWHALKCIRCGACMNTCPVYRRGGGLSYGATYSGPIGVILDPGFDLSKYRELPFHSTLCGSCTEVCPVKIDISDQIYKWRRVVADQGLLSLTKRVGMGALGTTLAHPSLFHGAESVGESALAHLPRFVLYNPLNPWGKHRELPAVPPQTFREWFMEREQRTGKREEGRGKREERSGTEQGMQAANGGRAPLASTPAPLSSLFPPPSSLPPLPSSLPPRDAILAAVRAGLPQPAVALPASGAASSGARTSYGYKEHFTHLPEVASPEADGASLDYFKRQLEAMGGRSFDVADAAAARVKVAELFPAAKVVCSAVPEVSGTRRVQDVRDPHELNDVDVGVVRSSLGVAEAGAVWLTQDDLVVNALGVLSQHLVVLLDPAAIVDTMHDAYARIKLAASPYGVFMAGPSATGDIEGVIIHGAQGARTLTALFLAPSREGPR